MNFSIICRTKQSFICFQTIRLQCSSKLLKKFSTKVHNIRPYENHSLFTQRKTTSYNGCSNFNKINLYQSFTINKMCRSITTTQNDMGETVGISSTSSQETITENIDSFTDIIEPTTSDAVIETALKIGDFKAMGLANFTPVGLIEEFFEILHVSTGLPWWGTITLATLILRLGFFPLVIKNQKLVAKFTEIQPEAQKLMDQIKKARSKGDQYTLMNKTVELKQLYSDNNIDSILSPFLLPLIQMPFFISFFISLRKMAELPVPGFTQGGILWFKDLSVPDPQVILPFLVSFGFILTLELGAESGALKNSQGTGLRWFFRILSITSIFFTMQLPSAVLYYFFCANTLAFTQSQLLKNKRVRNYFGLPKLKINDIVKQKSFMEQWREWNASASAEVNKNKKRKKRL